MKKFIIKILLFFIAVFFIDQVVGIVFKKWTSRVTTSSLGRDNYVCDHCNEDILIFGSSRANYHYNAKMIEDSLGTSTYNCGTSGFGILWSYGRLRMLTERYHPKLILLEITPEFDLVESNKNYKDLKLLRSHYDRPYIKDIFEKVDSTEKLKMLSYLYRYNSNFVHNPLRLLKPIPFNKNAIGVQGFVAQHEEFDSMKVSEKKDKEEFKLDKIKQFYLREFVKTAKENSQVVFVVSPYWQGRSSEIFESARQLADSLKIPFFDYSNSPKFYHKDEYFKDGSHLNARGADEFTKDLITDLRKHGLLE